MLCESSNFRQKHHAKEIPSPYRKHYAYLYRHISMTPPKINIEPENDGLEDDFPLPGVYSQVPC